MLGREDDFGSDSNVPWGRAQLGSLKQHTLLVCGPVISGGFGTVTAERRGDEREASCVLPA